MVSIGEVQEILEELVDELPEEAFRGLSGGIFLEESIKYHPQVLGDRALVMGHYSRGPLGPSIAIYYGSFMEMYGELDPDALRIHLRETLYHELTHHLELQMGIHDLEAEDEAQLRKMQGREFW